MLWRSWPNLRSGVLFSDALERKATRDSAVSQALVFSRLSRPPLSRCYTFALYRKKNAWSQVRAGQTRATSCNIQKCCQKNLTIFKLYSKTIQPVATGWPNTCNTLSSTMLQDVALKLLRAFGRAFKDTNAKKHRDSNFNSYVRLYLRMFI